MSRYCVLTAEMDSIHLSVRPQSAVPTSSVGEPRVSVEISATPDVRLVTATVDRSFYVFSSALRGSPKNLAVSHC